MSLLCAAIALLVEFQPSLGESDGSVSQVAVGRGDASPGEVESREHEMDKQGEESLEKRASVSS